MGETRHRLVVGIDFGTTYTGVSYGWSEFADDSDIIRIDSWPAKGSLEEHAFKVPTQIAYAAGDGEHSRKYWGYQIESGVVRCAWIKLLLDKDTLVSPNDDPGLREDINQTLLSLPDGKDVQRVTTDFFKELYNHTMDKLEASYPEKIIMMTPINYWFTMPAIWSDDAQIRTLKAAESAGFGAKREKDNVFVITEPEAAALATLTSSAPVFGDKLEADERLLICDCGGGTVDLTSYKVINDDPWELAECCVGDGGKCGGTYLDRNLHQLLSDRFKNAFTSLRHDKIGQGSKFMQDFEWNKRVFGKSGETLRGLRLVLPTSEDINPQWYDAEECLVLLTENDMKLIFEPVVKKIIELVSKQVKNSTDSEGNSIDYLMLVGGLGGSPYLRQNLHQWCVEHRIRMGSPENSWGIVAQGAVVRGLELATVTVKKCRRHYGIISSQVFQPGVDNEAEAYRCQFTGRTMAPGYMSWSIRRGEDIVSNEHKALPFYQVITAEQSTVVIKLQTCSQDEAPVRHDSSYVEDMKDIVTNLGNLDMSRFESKLENGKKLYKFDFVLEVILGHEQGTIAFRIKVHDEVVGQTSVDFS